MTTDKPIRRTQEERRTTARATLIKAAQDCLTELGFVRTTLSAICKRAGMSSGALTHHFPSKNAIIVAACLERQTQWLERMSQAKPTGIKTIREEVEDLRRQMEVNFPISYDFFWALRTDDGLREELQRQMRANEEPFSATFTFPGSELGRSARPVLALSVMTCFLRGLMLEALINDQQSVDAICDYFIEAMASFIATSRAASVSG